MSPDELIQGYFDGSLAPEQEDALRLWLEEDDAHLEEFKSQIEVHATLWEEKLAAGADVAKAPATRRLSRRSTSRRPLATAGGGSRPWLWIPAFAAAAAMAALVIASVRSPSSTRMPERTIVRDPTPKLESPPVTPTLPSQPVPPPPPRPAPSLEPKPRGEPPPVPQPAPPPEPPKFTAPKPPMPDPAPSTVVAMASIEDAQGDVLIQTSQGPRPVAGRPGLLPGEGLTTVGPAARVSVVFPDRTRLEVGPDTRLLDIHDRDSGRGRRLRLESGRLAARVSPQPAGMPMEITTPHGRATVLGTELRLVVSTNFSPSTRLDVREGRVGFRRTGASAQVVVAGGHFAVMTPQADPKPLAIRETAGLVAAWGFNERRGSRVRDVSGVGPALPLLVESPAATRWTTDGLRITGPTRLSTVDPAAKIVSACRASNELTIEAWITPAPEEIPPSTEPARIVTISSDQARRVFTLEQSYPEAAVGSPMVSGWRCRFASPGAVQTGAGTVKAGLQHVLLARGSDGTARLYLDGVEAGRRDATGDFTLWPDGYRLALGGEFEDNGPRSWRGTFHFVAIYSRALTPEAVDRHHFAGPRP